MRKPTIYIDSDDGDLEIDLPCKWEICSHCRGNGTSSAYLGAITQSDREPGGSWEDPDEFEDYMRGAYDRTCDECGGSGKVEVVDHEQLDAETLKAWNEQCEADAFDRAVERAERRMGC